MADQITTLAETPKFRTLSTFLETRKGQIAKVLPKHLTPDRILKVALLATLRTPKLLECSPESLYLAILKCSELGLEPGGALGHAHLVPFKNDVQLIIGYQGLIELALRTGELETIEARIVYANDKFTLRFGNETTLSHEPYLAGDPGPQLAVYAVARRKDSGELQIEPIPWYKIEALQAKQLAGIREDWAKKQSPWTTALDEMARKTAVRRLSKYLRLSPEKAEALSAALDYDGGQTIDTVAVPTPVHALPPAQEQVPPPTRTQAVKEKVAAAKAKREEHPATSPDEEPPPFDPDEPPPPESGEVRAPATIAAKATAAEKPAEPARGTPDFVAWLLAQMKVAPDPRSLAQLSARKGDCPPESHKAVLDAWRARHAELTTK
jgi:recombination protein RecT